jgi:hypothetical protein
VDCVFVEVSGYYHQHIYKLLSTWSNSLQIWKSRTNHHSETWRSLFGCNIRERFHHFTWIEDLYRGHLSKPTRYHWITSGIALLCFITTCFHCSQTLSISIMFQVHQ